MEVITGAFNAETITLDNKHFKDCMLLDCTLLYAGGPVIFERTALTGCRYRFCGEARRTLDFLEFFGMLEDPNTPECREPAYIH